jgi:ATP-dependent DNA helicase RecG
MADVFYRRGIIEQWGRGTLKIIDLTEQAGLITPEFEVRGGEVVVRFHPDGYVPPSRVTRDLTPLQQELLAVLAAIGPASLSSLRANLAEPVPEPTVKDNLQILRQLQLVHLQGRARGARWRVVR